MKLVRAFIAFVVVSLFVGIGSAFNGQKYVDTQEELSTNNVEKVEVDNTNESELTEVVDKKITDVETEKKVNNNNSFSASKEEKIEKKNQDTKKAEKINTQTTTKQNENIIQESKQPVEEKEEISQTNTQVEEKSPTDNSSNNDDKINATYYSITKGIAEYDTESSCKSAGLSIQNKELDAILDWNEEHPDNPKSRTIGSSMCIIVMKNGKEHWFLHFLTISGENLDNELKNKYR